MTELAAGHRVGPFEILARLGAGGMGEVYRARDTRLGRLVALKCIRPDMVANASRIERFTREARAVARLTHPNISTLYDHVVDDDRHFLVIEHLEGITLATRLAQAEDGLEIGEALSIAIAIGDALAFAHRQGIVHRDVKPSNVMLTPLGVKLLDFGLAMLREEDEQPPGSAVTTRTWRSSEHTIVGTLPYMAPEQLAGKADSRTDVFAFGAVLYEMVTGRRAFDGETDTAIMAAILERDPPQLAAALPSASPALDRAVRKCLAKGPDARWQSMADLTDELRWIAQAPDRSPSNSEKTQGGTTSRQWPLARMSALVAAAGVLGAAIALLWSRGPSSTVLPLSHLSFALPSGVSSAVLGSPDLAVSPDGSTVAFLGTAAGITQIFVRSLAETESMPLPGTTGARSPFFSPDGQWIGFFADGRLMRTPSTGGSPMVICTAPHGEGVWAEDGFIYFSSYTDAAETGISRVSAEGGEPVVLTRLDREKGETHHSRPQLLPGTGALLYAVRRQAKGVMFALVTRDARSGQTSVVVDGARRGLAFPDGTLLYELNATLFLAQFDEETLSVSQPTVIVDRLPTQFVGSSWAATSQVLVYDPGRDPRRRFVWVQRDGTYQPVQDAPTREYFVPRLSPDNTRIAAEIPAGPDVDSWVYDIPRATLTKFTVDGLSRYPTWTPDGKFISVSRRNRGGNDIYWREADESGEWRELIGGGGRSTWVSSWSPDMRTLVYSDARASSPGDIWSIQVNGDRTPRAIMQTPASEYGGWFSPDGRWLAYVSDRSGQFELFVKGFSASGPGQQLSPDGAREPRWSPDGRELFYRKGDEMLSIAVDLSKEQLTFEKPRVMFTGAFYQSGGPGIINYDVSADGKRFLMLEQLDTGQPVIRVLQGYRQLRK